MRIFAAQNWLYQPGDLACKAYRGSGYTIAPVGYPSQHDVLPVLVSNPAQGVPAGTVLFLKGGPYQNLFHGLAGYATTNHLLARWGKSVSIVVPAFLGNDRVRVAEGDVGRACSEVEALTTALEARDGKPVCVIASSMAVAVVAPLVSRYPDTRFLMLAPLAAAPRIFVERARALGTPALPIVLSALHGGRDLTLPADAATLSYYGAEQEQTLADRLGPGRHGNVHLVYAKGDVPVTPGDVTGLSDVLAPGAITRLPSVGHPIEDDYTASAYRPIIDAFLEQCLARRHHVAQ